jgi:hypothetical protein
MDLADRSDKSDNFNAINLFEVFLGNCTSCNTTYGKEYEYGICKIP